MSNDDIIDTLNDLIETCKDGEYGFRTSAEHAESTELRSLLTQRAEDCAKGSRELQAKVVELGGTPDSGGSAAGAIHRGWVSVRSVLTGHTDLALLEECERGEDQALDSYGEALEDDLPPQVRTIVERQCQGVQANHDQILALRDRLRATA